MSTMIGADIEQLQALVDALRRGSENLQHQSDMARKAMTAMQGSEWSGRHRTVAEELWSTINQQFEPGINRVAELGQRVGRFAERLTEAGQSFGSAETQGGNGITPLPTPVPTPTPPALPLVPSDPAAPVNPSQPPSSLPLPLGKTNDRVLSQLSGCTHYVASKFNLDGMGHWPNAEGWDNAARAAGYPVDRTPAAGSIMVFEPRTLDADASAGHVAVVEAVTREGDHYKVTVSEASVPRDAHDNAIYGAHTTPKNRTFMLHPGADGVLYDQNNKPQPGVSFIHGKA